MQTRRPARPHRKRPLPRARVPWARLLGRDGPSAGPGGGGGGARRVSGPRGPSIVEAGVPTGCLGNKVQIQFGWCRKFIWRRQGDESGEVGASQAGSFGNTTLQRLSPVQQASGSPGGVWSGEVAGGHFPLGSRLDWKHF